eukprot:TRINITY_DN9453_c0_g6_i3.p1 TRINITY_DN9453_c0_g6~~TRINITY_DN9453_c0_g6_i3.p1  ORF type:complete len:243 (-),score=61.30 TRINITY_DN9453_c0_g6_i3:394-1122(-)
MTNNALIFYQQQRNAFYGNQFELLTAEELEAMVGKCRVKSAEFPAPEMIFDKYFRFLNGTLRDLQAIRLKEANTKPAEPPKKNTIVKKEREVASKEKKAIKTPQVITISRVSENHKTKLGVLLENNPDTDSDNSIIIPSEFKEIIANTLSGKKIEVNEDLEQFIESAPITKKELRLNSRTNWVNDLLNSDTDEPNKSPISVAQISTAPLLILAGLQTDKELAVNCTNKIRYGGTMSKRRAAV